MADSGAVAGSSECPHPERRLRLVEDAGPEVDLDDDVETLLRPLLLEAEQQMRKVRRSLDAEMWASELFGMVSLAMPDADPTDREDACLQVAALLVGHAGVFRVVVCVLLGLSLDHFWNFDFGLGGVSVIEIRGGRAVLRGLNLEPPAGEGRVGSGHELDDERNASGAL